MNNPFLPNGLAESVAPAELIAASERALADLMGEPAPTMEDVDALLAQGYDAPEQTPLATATPPATPPATAGLGGLAESAATPTPTPLTMQSMWGMPDRDRLDNIARNLESLRPIIYETLSAATAEESAKLRQTLDSAVARFTAEVEGVNAPLAALEERLMQRMTAMVRQQVTSIVGHAVDALRNNVLPDSPSPLTNPALYSPTCAPPAMSSPAPHTSVSPFTSASASASASVPTTFDDAVADNAMLRMADAGIMSAPAIDLVNSQYTMRNGDLHRVLPDGSVSTVPVGRNNNNSRQPVVGIGTFTRQTVVNWVTDQVVCAPTGAASTHNKMDGWDNARLVPYGDLRKYVLGNRATAMETIAKQVRPSMGEHANATFTIQEHKALWPDAPRFELEEKYRAQFRATPSEAATSEVNDAGLAESGDGHE